LNREIGKVTNVRVDKNGQIELQVEVDGSPLGNEQPRKTENEIAVDFISAKLLKYKQYSLSGVKAASTYSALIGSPNNRIVSTKNNGNYISGKLSILAHPENRRINVSYILNGLLTSTMASSIITPIPTLIFDFPLERTVKTYSSMLNDYKDFLDGLL